MSTGVICTSTSQSRLSQTCKMLSFKKRKIMTLLVVVWSYESVPDKSDKLACCKLVTYAITCEVDNHDNCCSFQEERQLLWTFTTGNQWCLFDTKLSCIEATCIVSGDKGWSYASLRSQCKQQKPWQWPKNEAIVILYVEVVLHQAATYCHSTVYCSKVSAGEL